MKISLKTQCVVKLDFHPIKPTHSALPAFCWRGVQLNGFTNIPADSQLIEMADSGQSLPDIYQALYPSLSLPELARIEPLWQEYFPHQDFTHLISHNSPELFSLFVVIRNLPIDIQNSISVKKMGLADLSALLELDTKYHQELLNFLFTQAQLSKRELAQALDWTCDLILFNTMPDLEILRARKNIIQFLRSIRYQETAASDQIKQQKFSNIRWPRKSSTRFFRQGDQSGIELTMRLSSPGDISRLTQELGRIELSHE